MNFWRRFLKKRKTKKDTTGKGVPVDHSLVRELDPYDFRVAHKRLAFLFRLSVMNNVMMLFGMAVLATSFSAILPVKEVRLALLKADELENKLVRVEPISATMAGIDLFLEQKAKRYVKLLVDIDPISQEDRLNEAWKMTARDYYRRFRAERITSGAIRDAIDSGLVRSALIESVSLIKKGENEWQYGVDFTQVDTRSGEDIERRELRAYVKMTTNVNNVEEEDLYENPLGILVLDMALKARE